MSKHSNTLKQLYDYVKKELPQDQCRKIEEHLQKCNKCTVETEELRFFISATINSPQAYSDECSQEFWQNFAFNVEQRIQSREIENKKLSSSLWDAISSFLILRKRQVIVYSSAIAVLIVTLALLRISLPPNRIEKTEQVLPHSIQLSKMDERVGKYFRKSRALLVGISNMNIDDNQSTDLSAERKVSRELVHEARYLQRQLIDIRSAKLVGDVERVLIEFANTKEENDIPNVEIVRSSIHEENLLFKIRMAESKYDNPLIMNVNNTNEGDRR